LEVLAIAWRKSRIVSCCSAVNCISSSHLATSSGARDCSRRDNGRAGSVVVVVVVVVVLRSPLLGSVLVPGTLTTPLTAASAASALAVAAAAAAAEAFAPSAASAALLAAAVAA
tara:strand:+ start:230 stop:571 length:342 start_codon:yes stop_codon:yes gene_type:complete